MCNQKTVPYLHGVEIQYRKHFHSFTKITFNQSRLLNFQSNQNMILPKWIALKQNDFFIYLMYTFRYAAFISLETCMRFFAARF